jgi:hypothetical protein
VADCDGRLVPQLVVRHPAGRVGSVSPATVMAVFVFCIVRPTRVVDAGAGAGAYPNAPPERAG